MIVIKYRKFFYIFSATLIVLSIAAIFVRGLHVGIDFTGGSAVEMVYSGTRPDVSVAQKALSDAKIEGVTARPFGDTSFIFETQSTATSTHVAIYNALLAENASQATITMKDPYIIGPSIGAELRSKAFIAVATVILGIMLFVTYAFRQASERLSSWVYGVITVFTFAHDVIIPIGAAAALGLTIDSLFIIAILSILGLSVHDTIVVFDRVRENIKLKTARDFKELVGKSLEQTFVRSLNTSMTIMFVLIILLTVGPETTRDFALVLAVGLAVGTYSSIFIASPLLVEAEERIQEKKKLEGKKK